MSVAESMKLIPTKDSLVGNIFILSVKDYGLSARKRRCIPKNSAKNNVITLNLLTRISSPFGGKHFLPGRPESAGAAVLKERRTEQAQPADHRLLPFGGRLGLRVGGGAPLPLVGLHGLAVEYLAGLGVGEGGLQAGLEDGVLVQVQVLDHRFVRGRR